ncbi:vacuolar protein sorting-associated protein 35B-like [Gossypium australe]|uniref:Vacuolar protein sorting-associated protein 35B-like n=1 Tax=Gossypium australe TaxID=47621 RepID=A0A5B6X3A1_9ROSI|nr:vacuolar protein sorting-associated protein 35B-like [Gossypium australe]
MDCLTLHDAVMNCRRKQIVLKRLNQMDLTVPPILFQLWRFRNLFKRVRGLFSIFSRYQSFRIKVPVSSDYFDFADVFPKELPGLPPVKEVEFAIELVPGTSPILIALYRMASEKLK